MKERIPGIVIVTLLGLTAAAQDSDLLKRKEGLDVEQVLAQAKILGVRGAVMGNPVKGAPYSGMEITESTEVLADGTRIHNESQAMVYRDSEGRTRRETPESVTIYDPVAKVSYLLNPKEQTVRQLPLGAGTFRVSANGKNEVFTYHVTTAGPGEPESKKLEELKARAAAEAGSRIVAAPPEIATRQVFLRTEAPGTTENLGRQTIEGVAADGTRTTSTIEAGAIGNDRPIRIITERWFSSELQTLVRTAHTDPRTGEETFRLTNISRSEPAAYLFQVPAGYR
jgi:hypothetical protein